MRRFTRVRSGTYGADEPEYHVLDEENGLRRLGKVRYTKRRREDPWQIVDAGPGVPPRGKFHTFEEAAAGLLALRAEAEEEGLLHVDETGLRRLDRDILDFETDCPVFSMFGKAKADVVRERFDMSMTRYYVLLNTLMDRPEALDYAPMAVKRLRRLRDRRREERSPRRLNP